ncbi:tyrosine-type recombinase/integrase [Dactylosporangium roseum]|uniref:Tyrosine-type recombinase/integrase n=1 Tax=Dactylosporangium roseum TaxID=47989 RepID=A0ABY5Z9F6_9ACTN|nr:tyrosine-type recombinase/integrase [Dactylosporangium roseum]UWZ37452.1 tyrosine-type recombinase/integrase [Dactylosporangium roseum]
MSDLIDEHLEWCEEIGLSPNTISMRGYVLRDIDRHLVSIGVVDGVEAARPSEIRHFISTKNSRAWRHNIRNHLNAFFVWATVEAEILDWSPMGKVPRVRVPARVPKPVDGHLLNRIVEESIPVWRLVAILGGWAGLRDCEIARLSPADVGVESLRILGKGDKIGEVDLHPKVRNELDRYLGEEPYVVQAGGRADPRWISRRGGEYYKTLTGKRITPHMFRHSFITGVLAATGNLATAQAAARHSSITSTVGYAALVNGERRRGILALPDHADPA